MAFSDNFLAANMNKFPAEELPGLRQRLDSLNESQQNFVYAADYKDPTTALILSFFLGSLGVDRFYIGSIGFGLAKLFLSWMTLGILPLVDLFLIMGATRKANLDTLNNALNTATYQASVAPASVVPEQTIVAAEPVVAEPVVEVAPAEEVVAAEPVAEVAPVEEVVAEPVVEATPAEEVEAAPVEEVVAEEVEEIKPVQLDQEL